MTAFALAMTGHDSRLPASVCGPRGKVRPIIIGDRPWQVFEYIDNRPRPAQVSLMFACDTSWRRLRTFPADWRNLDDDVLADLGAHK